MRICVYGIALNEGHNARRFVQNAREADLVQIADTGSSDDTVAVLEAEGAVVTHIRIKPWRFDDARNAALALLPTDIDICVSLDLDTVLNPGWRKALEAAWTPGTTRAHYNEIWGRTPEGAPRQFLNNRIHLRHNHRWVSPCHEYVAADRIEEKTILLGGLWIEQIHDPNKTTRGQYLELLQLAARERPHEPRHAHYLGREYTFHGRPNEAIVEFERYLAFGPGGFATERNGTIRLLAECLDAVGRRDQALAYYRQAVTEGPKMRGAWIDLCHAYYVRERWAEGYEAAKAAIALPIGVAQYGEECLSGVLPEDIAAICGWAIGRHAEALAYGREAMRQAPTVERIAENVRKMEQVLAGQTGAGSGQTIASVKRG